MVDEEPRSLGYRNALLLMAVAAVVIVPGTIGVSFIDRDEGWYAQVVREMRWTGDWLVPRYLGRPWLGKPVLLYWLVGASTGLLGFGEWQARLVPVAATVVNTVLVGMLGGRLLGRRAGLWSGLLFVTFGLVSITGKMLLTDSLLLVWILAAVILHQRMVDEGVTHGRAALHWLAIGLGVLTKGPVVLIFAGAFWLATLWDSMSDRLPAGHDRQDAGPTPERHRIPARWARDGRWWGWAVVAVAVAGPWYVYIARHAGETFREQFLGFEIASRIANAPHGHSGPPGYYVGLSLAGLLPWTACVPSTIYLAVKRRWTDPAARLLLCWLVLPWLFLEIIRSKLPHYILPCYVPVAILLAARLVELLRAREQGGPLNRHERVMFGLVCWPMMVTGLLALAASRQYWGELWGMGALLAGLMVVVSFAAAWALMRRQRLGAGCGVVVVGVMAMHLAVGSLLLPGLEPARLSRRVAEAVNAMARPGDTVLLCGYKEPTTFVYLDGPARDIDPGSLADVVNDKTPKPTVMAITQRELDGLDRSVRRRLAPGMTEITISGVNYVKRERDTGGVGSVKLQREVVRLWRRP
jgi:4-amino-4-deoxy-L-arabinose transferase